MCLTCETLLAKLSMTDIFKVKEINQFIMLSSNLLFSINQIKLIIKRMNSMLFPKIKVIR